MKRYLALVLCSLPLLNAETFQVVEIQGDVQYRNPKTQSQTTLKIDDHISPKGKLRLKDGQAIRLINPMGDIITVKDKSYLVFNQIKSDPGYSVVDIDMFRGFANFKVTPLQNISTFTVKTNTAKVSVKGTEFNIDDNTVTVIEDTVELESLNDNTTVTLNEGESASVNENGEITTDNSSATTSTSDSSSEDSSSLSSLQSEQEQAIDDDEATQLIKLNLKVNDID